MRLRTLVAAVAPLPVAAVLVGASPATAATDRLVTLADNTPSLVDSARTGDVGGGQPITAALSLKLHNQGELEKFLADVQNPASPKYRHFLTPAEFTAAYGPSQADVDRAVAFLTQSGATGIQVAGNRQAITFTASATQVAGAFHTRMSTYRDTVDGRSFYANDSAPVVPAAVSEVVDNVVGLDNRAVKRHPHVVKSVTPATLKTAYGVTSALGTGSGVKVGFVEFDGYQQSNIAQFDSTNGLTTGKVTTVPVNGANYDSSPVTARSRWSWTSRWCTGSPRPPRTTSTRPRTAARANWRCTRRSRPTARSAWCRSRGAPASRRRAPAVPRA
ncbi:hypothetical protein GCM10029964_014300 [Kibdelosporangium lantanae]